MKALEKFKEDKEKNILACKYKNEVRALDFEVENLENVVPIDITTRDGRRVYQRGILYIMGMAFNRVYPKALLTVNCQLSNSIFLIGKLLSTISCISFFILFTISLVTFIFSTLQ